MYNQRYIESYLLYKDQFTLHKLAKKQNLWKQIFSIILIML